MSTRLQTSVESLSIVDGVWQEKASNLGIFEQSRLVPAKRGRGNLYVLVETVGSFPDPVQIQQRIIGIVKEYYRTPGSITAGIRLAIKAANTYLFEENLNAPREQRGVAGVTCMVLKDEDAYIGQCGPAVLCHVGKGQYQRLPQESTWLSSEKLQDVDISSDPPLGLRRDIEPELSHLYLREGDVFILASTSLVKVASDDEIIGATLHRGAHTVRGNLEGLAQGQDLSIIVVEILSADQAPVSIDNSAVQVRPSTAERAGVWSRIASGMRGLVPSSPEGEDGLEEEFEEEFEDEADTEGIPLSIDLRSAAESIWRFVTRLGRGLALLLSRVLPESEPTRRTRTGRKSKKAAAEMDRRWLYAAVLVPVLVILLVALTRFQAERAREAEYRQLWETVQEAKASAESSPSASEKRARLAEALTVLDQALQLKPEDEQLMAEQEAILEWLDGINHVFRIPYFVELQEFPDTESAKSQLSKVIVQGIDVFVLDLGTMRVYKYLLNESREALQMLPGDHVLLRKGDQRGDVIVDELLDIAWVGAGVLRGTSNLLALDKQGHVLEYDPLLGLKAFPTADSSAWVAPVAAVGYYGRLYLLDPQANRVIRYTLTNTGYEGPPEDYFSTDANVNLSNAVDMAIDGNLYILHSDGRITKYEEGVSADFPQTSLDEPLQAPSCIFATGYMDEGGYVYVLDTGNKRIVQFTKAGEFIRQFRGQETDAMNDVKGMFIDEEEKKLFLLDGSKLYLVNLPE